MGPYQRLTAGVYARAVKRMARYYVYVLGQVLLKGVNLGLLARSLAADDGAHLGS
jgi:hypothetical protein